jgi:uncharacterized membrane protein YphA (DoxX/SURF4 family)
MNLESALLLVGRLTLAFFFVPASLAKLLDHRAFSRGLRAYDVVPERLVVPLAATLSGVELVLGLALVVGVAPPMAGALAATLLAAFLGAAGVNIVRGRQIDCHCYGVAATTRIGPAIVARDVALMVIAVGITAFGAGVVRVADWFRPDAWGWSVVANHEGLLVVLLLTAWSVAIIYLLEWSVEARDLARNSAARISELFG